jgi:long-chain fatty acid transport protein
MNVKGWFWGIMLFLLGSAQTAFGGGVWLYETGTPDLGTAQAGRAALASDASTASANPAGMTRLDRSQLLVAVEGLQVNAKFDSSLATKDGGDGGNAGGFVPVASFHYVHSVTEDLKLGLSTGSYFGLGLDYGENWAGRYYVQKAELVTFAVNPGIGYRVNDVLSVGAGVSLVYAELEQTVAIYSLDPQGDGQVRLKDDNSGYGFNIGFLAEPTEKFRFGLTYRSAVDLEFKNVAELSNIGPILKLALVNRGLVGSNMDLDLTIPQSVMASSVCQVTDEWAVLANIGWQNWSEYGKKTLTLRSENDTSFTNEMGGYDDTWHFALGAQYRFDAPWLWSFGMAYDTSPLEDDVRTPDAPLDRQVRVGTGIQYDVNQDITVGVAYEYVDAGSAEFNVEGGLTRGLLRGDYSTNEIHAFAANLIYKF